MSKLPSDIRVSDNCIDQNLSMAGRDRTQTTPPVSRRRNGAHEIYPHMSSDDNECKIVFHMTTTAM